MANDGQSLRNADGSPLLGALRSRTMMVMITAITPSENASTRALENELSELDMVDRDLLAHRQPARRGWRVNRCQEPRSGRRLYAAKLCTAERERGVEEVQCRTHQARACSLPTVRTVFV